MMMGAASNLTADGLLKSAYEIARDERIRANQDVLKQLGFLHSAESSSATAPSAAQPRPKIKRVKRERRDVSPQRKSKRLQGEVALPSGYYDEENCTPSLSCRRKDETDMSKYERLIEKHVQEWDETTMGKLPQTATYEHTVMRVKTMAPSALSTRVRVIENARGKFCITKMRQFAEVLIIEGYSAIADEASAALDRLLRGLPAPPKPERLLEIEAS